MSALQVPAALAAAPPSTVTTGFRRYLTEATAAGFPRPSVNPLLPPWVSRDRFISKSNPDEKAFHRLLGKCPAYPRYDGTWREMNGLISCFDDNWYIGDDLGANVGLILGQPWDLGRHGRACFGFIDIDTFVGTECDTAERRAEIIERATRISATVCKAVWGHLGTGIWIRTSQPGRAGILVRLPDTAEPMSKTVLLLKGAASEDVGKIEILTRGQQVCIGGRHVSGHAIEWFNTAEYVTKPFPDPATVPVLADFAGIVAAIDAAAAALAQMGISSSWESAPRSARAAGAVSPSTPPPSPKALIDLVSGLNNPARVDRDTGFPSYAGVMLAAAGAARALPDMTPADHADLRRAAANWCCRWESPKAAPDFVAEVEKWESDWCARESITLGWDYLLRAAENVGGVDVTAYVSERAAQDMAAAVPPLPAPAGADGGGHAGVGGATILDPSAPMDSARAFLKSHQIDGIGTLHRAGGDFYIYRGTRYEVSADDEVRAEIYNFLDRTHRADGDTVRPFSPNKSKVANVLEAVAAVTHVAGRVTAPAWLGTAGAASRHAPGQYIACVNGLLHLPTRAMSAHTPSFFNLNALDFDYDPTAPAPTGWLKFLDGLWPQDAEAVATLQEIFGLLLTGETRFQKAFLIVGPKRSGKGTIARVLTQLLGQGNVCGPTLSDLASQFGLAPLIGKRVAIISDARLGGRADQQAIVERFLTITGEDSITVDRKFREGWTGKLDTRFMLLTNELPRLTDSSGALASRFVILTLHNSFYGHEDLGLSDRLSMELPGILRWALDGWQRLQQRGFFVTPSSSLEAHEELEDLGSPISAFLKDRCKIGAGRSTSCSALFQAWAAWCQDQHRDHTGNLHEFGRNLRAAAPSVTTVQVRTKNGGRERRYEGVGEKTLIDRTQE